MSLEVHSITFDCQNAGELAQFWGAALNYDASVGKIASIAVPPDGKLPRLLFLDVPEAKAAKNRVHLDILPSDSTMEEEVDRLVALGAQKVEVFELPYGSWTVMLDPEGNEFCIEKPDDS
ncbi:MAG: VOC family protein [SAR202 cluster bacterium]|nr:VOC family protein [SAR202 cluster bacterium]MDP6514129.1 VOC family protein [SAR202 cluster bacterium]MDP6714065.1 VOC family protein [SAR202 cluster bacterium]